MRNLKIVIWNVLHGLAVSIFTPNEKFVVYDAGRSADFSPLTHLRSLGTTHIDYFFLSHPHADHLKDLEALLQMSPETMWRPRPQYEVIKKSASTLTDRQILDRYHERLDSRYVQPATNDPTDPAWSGGCDFRVFQPPFHEDLNNMSLLVFVGYGGRYVALTGDLEGPGWNALLTQDGFTEYLRATNILLAPHHGRAAGVSAAAFQWLSPQLCVISDGPFSDTSSGIYSALASGANVKTPLGVTRRQALSTRKDGHVILDLFADGTWTVEIGGTTP